MNSGVRKIFARFVQWRSVIMFNEDCMPSVMPLQSMNKVAERGGGGGGGILTPTIDVLPQKVE